MRAVSNTSPISSLASIGRLSLLKSQFTEIWIPPAVSLELRAHPSSSALADIQNALREEWIRLSVSPTSHLFGVLSQHLHPGEAEAVALAAEIKANIVLIDEREGRQFAIQAGLSVTGVLGILLRAKLNGDIAELASELQSLRTNGNFFISQQLEARMLHAAGE